MHWQGQYFGNARPKQKQQTITNILKIIPCQYLHFKSVTCDSTGLKFVQNSGSSEVSALHYVSGHLHALVNILPRKETGSQWTGGWVDNRASLDVVATHAANFIHAVHHSSCIRTTHLSSPIRN